MANNSRQTPAQHQVDKEFELQLQNDIMDGLYPSSQITRRRLQQNVGAEIPTCQLTSPPSNDEVAYDELPADPDADVDADADGEFEEEEFEPLPRNHGSDPEDFTDWPWELVASSIIYLPAILYQREPTVEWEARRKEPIPNRLDPATNQPIRSPANPINGPILRYFPGLPDRIASNAEEWFIEWCRRLHPSITWGDITARILESACPKPNALNYRVSRFLDAHNMLSWRERGHQDARRRLIFALLRELDIPLVANTTRGLSPGLVDVSRFEEGGRILLKHEKFLQVQGENFTYVQPVHNGITYEELFTSPALYIQPGNSHFVPDSRQLRPHHDLAVAAKDRGRIVELFGYPVIIDDPTTYTAYTDPSVASRGKRLTIGESSNSKGKSKAQQGQQCKKRKLDASEGSGAEPKKRTIQETGRVRINRRQLGMIRTPRSLPPQPQPVSTQWLRGVHIY